MVFADQTSSFRSILSDLRDALPESARSSSSTSKSRSASRGRRGKGKKDDTSLNDEEEFLKEAYRIHTHLRSLQTLLKTIRKPYLSLQEPPHAFRRSRQPRASNLDDDGNGEDSESAELRRWESSKFLSDRERDEIDVRGKMILRRCRERVGILEDSEKARIAHTAPPSSALFTFLPSLAPPSSSSKSNPILTAHRAGIIWTLTSLLASISATQSDMQEERSKRRLERSRNLGAGAELEAAKMGTQPSTLYTSSNPSLPGIIVPSNEPPIETLLSPTQLQQFESENSTLLDQMSTTLSAVLHAEKSLLEISALQTELVNHLVQQTEITDRLYDEAVGSVADLGMANTQLKKAKERGGDARLFLLVFLIGASMALLFLDWYS